MTNTHRKCKSNGGRGLEKRAVFVLFHLPVEREGQKQKGKLPAETGTGLGDPCHYYHHHRLKDHHGHRLVDHHDHCLEDHHDHGHHQDL